MSSIYAKLMKIQSNLKVNKSQYNSFGKYNYRSCEDILEGVKPLLAEVNCVLVIKDEVVRVGERYYVQAQAILIDAEDGKEVSSVAMAREEESKKGMDGSQVTGASSSYARKYALNGLFAIDDTKDADTKEPTKSETLSDKQIQRVFAVAKNSNLNKDAIDKWIKSKFQKDSIKELTTKEYDALIEALERAKETK